MLLGYNIYLRQFRRLPPPPAEEAKEPSKLVIYSADYRAWKEAVLEDANIKLASVASDILRVSGRAMLKALIEGEKDPATQPECPLGRMSLNTTSA